MTARKRTKRKELESELYRACPVHGIIGADWNEDKEPQKCPQCGRVMRKLTAKEIQQLEKFM